MFFKSHKKAYRAFVYFLILFPNLVVIGFGMESFPYTCAPMFAHYIDETTPLYIQEFKGFKNGYELDLVDKYGKNPMFFNRHFHCKIYGIDKKVSPYSNWFNNNNEKRDIRVKNFLLAYNSYLANKHDLVLDSITFSLIQVDKNRSPIKEKKPIGSFYPINGLYRSYE